MPIAGARARDRPQDPADPRGRADSHQGSDGRRQQRTARRSQLAVLAAPGRAARSVIRDVNYFKAVIAGALCMAVLLRSALSADAAFQDFLASLWPSAQQMGVSRATFDAATRGLEPDYGLPDLVIPGRPERPSPGQAEFVQAPADYLKESS